MDSIEKQHYKQLKIVAERAQRLLDYVELECNFYIYKWPVPARWLHKELLSADSLNEQLELTARRTTNRRYGG